MLSHVLAPVRLLTVFLVLAGAGLVAAAADALSFVLVRPVSLAAHRRVVTAFSHAFLLCGTFLLERWARIRVRTYGDRVAPSTSALCIVNHCSNVDWCIRIATARRLVGLAWFSRWGYPFPGNVKAVVKASLGRVPIFGWVLRFSEFVFLARSWEADREQFLAKLGRLCSFAKSSYPLCVILYPEGSRLTPQKLVVSQKYARQQNFPVFDHVLLPRFKGFIAMLPVLRPHIDSIVDGTVLFEGPVPSMATVCSGKSDTIIHVHVAHHPVSSIPADEKGMTDWLLARWVEKDARIARFKADPASVGVPHSDPAAVPSVAPLYALFFVFLCAAAPVLYATSRIENGLRLLLGGCFAFVATAAIFVMVNLRPSRKGRRGTSPKVD